MICFKDWERLAIKLGFLEYDIQSYKLKNKGFNYETVSAFILPTILKNIILKLN